MSVPMPRDNKEHDHRQRVDEVPHVYLQAVDADPTVDGLNPVIACQVLGGAVDARK